MYALPQDSAVSKLTHTSDVAEKHGEADVKGIDVAPIQPAWVPPNARYELQDFNVEWGDHGDENKYDLIHERELLGSVTDWSEFYGKCFRYTWMVIWLLESIY